MSRTTRRSLRSVAISLAAFACASMATAGDLTVMVRTAVGEPASGATVCAGTPQQPTQFGAVTTDAAGKAILRNVPAGAVQVTAHQGPNGLVQALQMSAASQSISMRLPIALTNRTCGTPSDATTSPLFGGSAAGAVITEPQVSASPNFKIDKSQLPNKDIVLSAIPPIGVRKEYCFGALGAQCGGAQYNLPTHALCALGKCKINAGSWEHDECCYANPRGMACQAGPLDYVTGHSGACVNEWNKALARLNANLNWTRPVDFNRPNSSGRVEFALYCAPTGTPVHRDDVRYCCSRQADPAPALSVTTLPSSQLRVCR